MLNSNEKNIELIFIFLLMFLSPGLSFVYLFIKLLSKKDFEYYIYFSMLIGLNGYRWNPVGDTFDIVRHQKTFKMLRDHGYSYFLSRLIVSESPLQIIFTKLLSYWKDPRILNAVIPFIGMLMLSYIVYEASSENKKVVTLYSIVVFSSFRVLQFTSGLWNFFAIIMFSFAYLFLESRNKYFVYILSVLTHFSMVYPLVIIFLTEIIFKLLDEENLVLDQQFYFLFFSLFMMFFAFISPTVISKSLNSLSLIFKNWNFIKILDSRFRAYFVNQVNHTYLMNYRYILLEISKLFLIWIFLCLNSFLDLEKKSKHFYYLTLLTSITIGLGMRVRILLRFSIMPLLLVSADLTFIEKDWKNMKSKKTILLIGIVLFILVQLIYQLYSMKNAFLI